MFNLRKRNLMVAAGVVTIFLNGISVKANTKTTQESLPQVGFPSTGLPMATSVPPEEAVQQEGVMFNAITGLPVPTQTPFPMVEEQQEEAIPSPTPQAENPLHNFMQEQNPFSALTEINGEEQQESFVEEGSTMPFATQSPITDLLENGEESEATSASFFKKETELTTATMATATPNTTSSPEKKKVEELSKEMDKEVPAATSNPFKEIVETPKATPKSLPSSSSDLKQEDADKPDANPMSIIGSIQEMQEIQKKKEEEKNRRIEIVLEEKEAEKVDLYSTGYVRVRNAQDKEKFLLKPGEKVEFLEEEKKTVKIKAKKGKGFVKKSLLVNSKEKTKKAVKANVKTFRTTGYCPCYRCSEGHSNNTASGRKARVNHTIAADRSVLPFFTEVYIEGLGRYEVEDVGGGVKGNHIDIYVGRHSQCDSKNRYNARVHIIKG